MSFTELLERYSAKRKPLPQTVWPLTRERLAVTGIDKHFEDERSQTQTDEIWPMFQNDAGHKGFSVGDGPITNNVIWDEYAPIGLSSPIVIPNEIILATSLGLVAVDLYTGENIWHNYEVIMSSKTPAYANDKIFAAKGSNIVALNESGAILWEQEIETGELSLVASNDFVFVAVNTNVYCLNQNDGTIIWSNSTEPMDGTILSDPAYENGKVYVAGGKKVVCFDASTGHKDWDRQVLGSNPAEIFYYGAVTLFEEKIYVISLQGKVFCLDVSDGSEIWSYQTSGYSFESSVAIAYNNVYMGNGSQVICLNALSGNLVWSYLASATVSKSCAVANEKVYIADAQKLYCLDAIGSGGSTSLIWEQTLSNPGTPAIAYNGLFIGSASSVYAFFDNEAPGTPTITSPYLNKKNDPVPFTVNAIDPDDNDLFYYFKWTIDGQWKGPFGPYPSGEDAIIEHTFPRAQTYNKTYTVTVEARDIFDIPGGQSSIVVAVNNTAPSKPTLNGPSIARVNEPFDIEYILDDYENDILEILWLPFGTTPVWHGEYLPGTYTEEFIFDEVGEYEIGLRVREKYGELGGVDKHGYEGPQADPLTIQVVESELEMGNITGSGKFLQGGKISVDLTAGSIAEENVEWSISVKGGILGRIDIQSEGITDINPEETITIETDSSIIGFGPININVTAISDGMTESITKTARAAIFFFWPINIVEI